MIRKLHEADRENVMAFVKQKPAENLFMIGDIEAFGFDKDFQEVWGDMEEDGSYTSVVLRYRDNFLVFAPEEFDADAAAELIGQRLKEGNMVSGLVSTVKEVTSRIATAPRKTREAYYSKCEKLVMLDVPDVTVKRTSSQDISRLAAFYDQVPEFEPDDNRVESLSKSMSDGVARSVYVEQDGEIVSTAMTAAENSMSAMIVGVATLDGFKKKGYASACMTVLCRELLDEGKYLCLFYDNPSAGTIYKRLGFRDIERWVMTIY